jgi:hypothetical protein
MVVKPDDLGIPELVAGVANHGVSVAWDKRVSAVERVGNILCLRAGSTPWIVGKGVYYNSAIVWFGEEAGCVVDIDTSRAAKEKT